jgi:hypothetical protein
VRSLQARRVLTLHSRLTGSIWRHSFVMHAAPEALDARRPEKNSSDQSSRTPLDHSVRNDSTTPFVTRGSNLAKAPLCPTIRSFLRVVPCGSAPEFGRRETNTSEKPPPAANSRSLAFPRVRAMSLPSRDPSLRTPRAPPRPRLAAYLASEQRLPFNWEGILYPELDERS